jgi:hypothetical protein
VARAGASSADGSERANDKGFSLVPMMIAGSWKRKQRVRQRSGGCDLAIARAAGASRVAAPRRASNQVRSDDRRVAGTIWRSQNQPLHREPLREMTVVRRFARRSICAADAAQSHKRRTETGLKVLPVNE